MSVSIVNLRSSILWPSHHQLQGHAAWGTDSRRRCPHNCNKRTLLSSGYPIPSMNEFRKHSATWVSLRHSSTGSPEDSFWPPSITFSTMADKLLPSFILLKPVWRTKFLYICPEYLFSILCLIIYEETLLKRLWKLCNTEFNLKVYTPPSIKLKNHKVIILLHSRSYV